MEIIESMDPAEWSYEFTCASCESKLRADANDLQVRNYTEGDQRDSYEVEWLTLVCPVCQFRTKLCKRDATQLPDGSKFPRLVAIHAAGPPRRGGWPTR